MDAVLLAGGTLRPRAIQERLLAVIEAWQGRRPVHLALADMSLAIAAGAAHFAALPERSQDRIRGGYPHSVYLELQRTATESAPRLVCVLPQGLRGGRGDRNSPRRPFDLLVNRPVRFTAYTSNRREGDAAGTLVPLDPNAFHPLPTLQTTIILDDERFNPRDRRRAAVRVQLEARLTELGGLQLALVDSESGRSWELAFNLRKPVVARPRRRTGQAGVARRQAPRRSRPRRRACALFFGKKQSLDPAHKVNVAGARSRTHSRAGASPLEHRAPAVRCGRRSIPASRAAAARSAHENAWLYLAGFVLRPGYGAELDHWRVMQLWECFDLGLVHKKEKSAQSNWWMMWRRTAGGIPAEEQERLFAAALPHLRRSAAEFVEGTRLLGSLERVALPHKLELAALLRRPGPARQGCQPVARLLGARAGLLGRVPLYTSAETVVPAVGGGRVLRHRSKRSTGSKPERAAARAVFSAACRRTNERLLDIHDAIRTRVVEKLARSGATAEQLRCVREATPVTGAQIDQLFGEQLPAGLRLSAG